MIPLKLHTIAELLGCPAPAANPDIDAIVTDSRKVRYGALFAALKGNRVDGHEYAATAASLGAVAILASRPLDIAQDRQPPILVVEDVTAALGVIARHLRVEANPVVVGITGSNGKTTVKEMVSDRKSVV